VVKNEADTRLDRSPRNPDKLVTKISVGRNHRIMRPFGFVNILPALAVLLEDFRPWRRYKRTAIVPKDISHSLHAFGHWEAHQR
jgi:hypothetical protein